MKTTPQLNFTRLRYDSSNSSRIAFEISDIDEGFGFQISDQPDDDSLAEGHDDKEKENAESDADDHRYYRRKGHHHAFR